MPTERAKSLTCDSLSFPPLFLFVFPAAIPPVLLAMISPTFVVVYALLVSPCS
ncbi:hypothetical protein BCR44DRAFT_1440182 [Catenaria anguillulae PL171]|uniref:Uncharacterized protein n=1 Tax=Catenaria anguillulae PL171 TaxID=765915 RepID=A0A1Y2HCW0_9FUNG|nr:hypothetical protein BCR44DRAFT_1440182 [Catenaria anguillulae PL171]